MKLTPWFSGDQKPVRAGVYQRKAEIGTVYAYWDGRCFGLYAFDKKLAERFKSTYSENKYLPWRGVMK